MPTSDSLFARATNVIPGGVNSPVRAFGGVGGTPRFIKRGEGCRLTDVDGRTYIDFCLSWGPLILGHAHPRVLAAIERAAKDGTSFGAPTEAEVLLAEKVCALVQPVEQVRFVSSGTEATMSAIRLARGFTGRDLIIKFAGCYHGHADFLLVQAGSGLATFGTPSSAGVPAGIGRSTLVAHYNDLASVAAHFDRFPNQIACVIAESVPANNGLILPERNFLRDLTDLAHRHGALMISDEVITGFRLGFGGAAARFGFTPDLMTFGKIIGGGLPVGAFGGRRDIMQHLAPLGKVYQAGTLSGNPVAMAAGLAALEVIEAENAYERLEQMGARFGATLRQQVDLESLGVALTRIGSIFWLYLASSQAPIDPAALDTASAARYRYLFHFALDHGIYLAPSAYEVGFLSLAHDDDALNRAAGILAEGLKTMPPLGATAP
ncbi:MAG: glutamate-1-semialdehyde 2,1-aminomutase [candidate division Zixibacteria bacterium]|nr:glutamate-1-semialdehyde 2,1-aminomutase [candidate division Zixibacteria bacterium]